VVDSFAVHHQLNVFLSLIAGSITILGGTCKHVNDISTLVVILHSLGNGISLSDSYVSFGALESLEGTYV